MKTKVALLWTERADWHLQSTIDRQKKNQFKEATESSVEFKIQTLFIDIFTGKVY